MCNLQKRKKQDDVKTAFFFFFLGRYLHIEVFSCRHYFKQEYLCSLLGSHMKLETENSDKDQKRTVLGGVRSRAGVKRP